MAKQLLIIEDNVDLAELLELTLTGAGHDVETTPSGLAGLLRSREKAFDAVLLDMQVEDLSGPGALRAIGDLCPDATVICMSAQPPGWAHDALNQGATACLVKPFSLEDLLALFGALASGEQREPGPPGDVRTLEPSDLARLATMSPDELDALPFGAIRVDERGRVTSFNSYEARASGRSPDTILGTSFAELAPCMLVKEFVSCLEEGFESARMDRVLRYVFPRHGARAVVALRLYYDPAFKQMWIFVSMAHGQKKASEIERK